MYLNLTNICGKYILVQDGLVKFQDNARIQKQHPAVQESYASPGYLVMPKGTIIIIHRVEATHDGIYYGQHSGINKKDNKGNPWAGFKFSGYSNMLEAILEVDKI